MQELQRSGGCRQASPIDKVTDYGEIVAYGVMSTPALAIDGEIKTTGRVPSVREITDLLEGATV